MNVYCCVTQQYFSIIERYSNRLGSKYFFHHFFLKISKQNKYFIYGPVYEILKRRNHKSVAISTIQNKMTYVLLLMNRVVLRIAIFISFSVCLNCVKVYVNKTEQTINANDEDYTSFNIRNLMNVKIIKVLLYTHNYTYVYKSIHIISSDDIKI